MADNEVKTQTKSTKSGGPASPTSPVQANDFAEFAIDLMVKLLDSIFVGMLKGLAVVAALTAFLVFLGWLYGPWLFRTLARVVGLHPAQFILSAGIIGAGVGAYYFKRKTQKYYGVVEMAFGMASGVAIAFTMSPAIATLAQWASLMSCGYVIQRGLNNISEAKPK